MLPLLVLILLGTPQVQFFMAQKATQYLSKELGTEVSVKKFRLNLLLRPVLEDIKVVDLKGNTLLFAKRIEADVQKIDFGNSNLKIRKVQLDDLEFNYMNYQGDSVSNLQFVLDYFSPPKKEKKETKKKENWKINISDVKINDGKFAMCNYNKPYDSSGIDFNHLKLSKLFVDIRDIVLDGSDIFADIKNISFNEQSGFKLDELTAKAAMTATGISAKKLKLKTPNSDIAMDAAIEFESWEAMSNFLEEVTIRADISPTVASMNDVVFFVPSLKGMEETVKLSGKIKGTVSSFVAQKLMLDFADKTHFDGDVRMTGLPNFSETYMRLKINAFKTHSSDIAKITVPFKNKSNKLDLPALVNELGDIETKGVFTGFVNDFAANATFNTGLGALSTDVLLTENKKNKTFSYNGKLVAKAINLGKLTNSKQLGTCNINANVKGFGIDLKSADLQFAGNITNIIFNENSYDSIVINGTLKQEKFNGFINISDELVKLKFAGDVDMSDSIPNMDFRAQILHANLSAMKLMKQEDSASISANIQTKLFGSSFDKLFGDALITDTKFDYQGRNLVMDTLTLKTFQDANGLNYIELASDYVNAILHGNYAFNKFPSYVDNVVKSFLPALSSDSTMLATDEFIEFEIVPKNLAPLTEIFLPNLYVDGHTKFSGSIFPGNGDVFIKGESPLIKYGNLTVYDLNIDGRNKDDKMFVDISTSKFVPTKEKDSKKENPFVFKNLKTTLNAYNNEVDVDLLWGDTLSASKFLGNISSNVSFNEFPRLKVSVKDGGFSINDTLWSFTSHNEIVIDTNKLFVKNFGIKHNRQFILANGYLSASSHDFFELKMNAFNLSILDFITESSKINLDGYISGTFNASEIYKSPKIDVDAMLEDFGFNGEYLGDAHIQSKWDDNLNELFVDTKVVYKGNYSTYYPLKILGHVYPERKDKNLDIKIDMDNFSLTTIEPFMEGIFSRMRGFASGNASITGTFADPDVNGKLTLMRSEFIVDFLKTSYSFTGDVNIKKNFIGFDNLVLTDSIGKTGVASGGIYHKNFSDWRLDVKINADNLAALNTTYSPNQIFYGKAIISGNVNISGPVESLLMRIQIKTEPGTAVFIPLNTATSVSENDFIVFVDEKSKDSLQLNLFNLKSNGLDIRLGIEATPDAQLGVILPGKLGSINVTGYGSIQLNVSTKGDYSMHGAYNMDKGVFMFNFQNVLKRNFEIAKGSKIVFNGSPFDSDISLRAVYNLRTSLSSLPGMSEYGDTRIPVNCILSLNNNLFNPDIKFSIQMPDVSPDIQRSVFSVIDTSSTAAMNQQMISLLLLNNFSSQSGISLNEANGLASSSELLTNQLNNWLSQISDNFDIGVKYRPGSDISTQDLELMVGTQLFDNRVTINGSVGNMYNASTQSSRWIGDFMAEIKLTKDGRYRMKMFNRTNSSLDVMTGQAPYTQGVGLLYRKEFDRIKEVFFSKKKP